MTDYAGRLIVHDREIHLEPEADTVAVGDTFEVTRGNGPREGDYMGIAAVAAIEHGSPVLDVELAGRQEQGR